MNTQAILKYQKISAQKCRLVANAVRGLPVNKAFEFLKDTLVIGRQKDKL